MVMCGAWQKLSPLQCHLMLFCSACLGVQDTKIQILNTWLLSAVYSQASSSPEQGFGSWFLEDCVKKSGCLACNTLSYGYIYHGCVQTLMQMVGTLYWDIISFRGILYPVIYLHVTDNTDWVQWACAGWLQTVPPGGKWYVLPESVVVICWTSGIWNE
jgi:hypothetical protein